MVSNTNTFTHTAKDARESQNSDTGFDARPTASKTDYTAFTKDVIKRFPKVIAELAK
ncbi:hypothetical protein M8997_021835 [Phyllobacterium sp. 21LDTY02-6]|jgi:hypothetical protein|uniref:hypothetical protein n=1 Tax=unclassified Phyllobacterium TaxID=2638441 RepID=UPI002021284B|nr:MULTISPECIES: hypothetical protein [unclassified Phyllobacterium]MCO4319835.1 hypothetical protein [Phyllobacterium sp. 21LDTY02-6]MCX8280575.1 hypothetical protein [Phyllobacterium sp. 0TCS1.6C]MCX8294976.1 hypothetical protein [Phyllobacterium sp. 0TCS1.6A]